MKKPLHEAPSTLLFDGSVFKQQDRKKPKEMPDYLVKPPVDEEALLRVRAQLKSTEKSKTNKKIPL